MFRAGLVGLFEAEGYALRRVYVAAVLLIVLVGLVDFQYNRGTIMLDEGYLSSEGSVIPYR